MRRRRAEGAANLKNLWSPPKKHEVEKRKYQRRARKALNGIWNYLEELESPPFLDPESIDLTRALIQPALKMATHALDSDFTADDSEAGQRIDGASDPDGRTDLEPASTEAQADAARLELDQLERTERTARADLESALRNQGYSPSTAKQMARSAVGTDFQSMLRDALTPRRAEQVNKVNTSEKTEEAQHPEYDAKNGDELTKNDILLTDESQPITEKAVTKEVPFRATAKTIGIMEGIEGELIHLGDGQILYNANWRPEADQRLERLKTIPWSPESIILYGKRLTLERQTVNYGSDYDYNKLAKTAIEFDGPVLELKHLLEAATGRVFGQCACNYYPRGEIGIGLHHDKRHPLLIV
jgi:hypothetical protein